MHPSIFMRHILEPAGLAGFTGLPPASFQSFAEIVPYSPCEIIGGVGKDPAKPR